MRRFFVVLIVTLAVAAGVAVLFRESIALRVMATALENNMRSDVTSELPDGIHVMLCGAGGPLPDPIRSGPCVAVIAAGRLFIVDAGSGAARNLAARRFNPGLVERVLLTHFHSDHIDGLGELAMLRWTAGTHQQPLPVHGPKGVQQVVDGFNRAYRLDSGYRTAHHGASVAAPAGTGAQAIAFAAPTPGNPVTVLDEGGLVVRAFKVEHEPVVPAVGYRFDYKGRSVLISGDTMKSQELLDQAGGVDLLVHEALSQRLVMLINQAAAAAGREAMQKITSDILDYHTTPVEAAEIAQAAQAKHLLFYHVVPPLPLPGLASVFLAGVSDVYAGPVTLGRDGTMVSLPAGSDSIEIGVR